MLFFLAEKMGTTLNLHGSQTWFKGKWRRKTIFDGLKKL